LGVFVALVAGVAEADVAVVVVGAVVAEVSGAVVAGAPATVQPDSNDGMTPLSAAPGQPVFPAV